MMQTTDLAYDRELLVRFEAGIDPLDPEHSRIPAQVLGYGEMSTVMTISGTDPNLVYKRMPMFHSEQELASYLDLYDAYQEHLAAAGINVVPATITYITPDDGNIVAYIIQERLDRHALANTIIHSLPAEEVERMFEAVLEGIGRVFAYNQARGGEIEIGFDAQISNWAVGRYQAGQRRLPDPVELIYIDTSSPLLRLHGEEQLDPELFLRSAPSFLRWLIRLLFLEDVMNRYYDRRQVIIDVLANLHKEKREDVIPGLIETANTFLEDATTDAIFRPLTEAEIARYYQEDARIWTVYLTSRRTDRWLHRVLGRPYPYVLPGDVDR
jgi:hypothetical protein